ncbi:MAG: hypothetical protein L6V88_00600 [Anaerotruncus sp.]|nr:MAG: hypothetical protein L6V88_00600 [Anaerotruncus sp.]
MPFFKRIFAAIAALMAVFAFASPAYAAEEDKPYYFFLTTTCKMQVEEKQHLSYHGIYFREFLTNIATEL